MKCKFQYNAAFAFRITFHNPANEVPVFSMQIVNSWALGIRHLPATTSSWRLLNDTSNLFEIRPYARNFPAQTTI
jgi:hypothetical protein